MALKDKAIAVAISVNKPQMTKKDNAVTREVALDKNASQSAVAVIKNLYPKHLVEPINTVEGATRRYVESVTAPWGRGIGLLPTALFIDFKENMNKFGIQFDQAVTVFLSNYAKVLTEAQREQGDMFDGDQYPDLAHLKAGFSFSVRYLPITTGDSLVLDLEKDTLKELRADIEKQTKDMLADAMKANYKRLYDAVERIQIQCSKPEGRIYDTLTGNLDELLRVLPALDLTDDKDFRDLCTQAAKLIVSPEAIKSSPEKREEMAVSAKSILESMKGVWQ